MKKFLAVFAAVLLMVSLALPALAENDRVIQVSGSGVVSLAADTATLQIGVNTRKESVKVACGEARRASFVGADDVLVGGSGVGDVGAKIFQKRVGNAGKKVRSVFNQ